MARVREPRIDLTVLTTHHYIYNRPEIIVLHDTEYHDYPGVRDLNDLGQYFKKVKLSAHIGVDGEGNTARYVYDSQGAWHCMRYNQVSLGIEQIGFARFTKLMWSRNHRAQLKKVAKWIAYWSTVHNIPICKGLVSNGSVVQKGVVTHKMLGYAGGGHIDPGKGYPFKAVLTLARYYKKNGWK